jgi:hypothetical protein
VSFGLETRPGRNPGESGRGRVGARYGRYMQASAFYCWGTQVLTGRFLQLVTPPSSFELGRSVFLVHGQQLEKVFPLQRT